ncbi:MAG TPA: hypothetical protein VGL95_08105 [Acetobacteraceae bacterium]
MADTRLPADLVGLVADRLVEAKVPLPARNAALAIFGLVVSDLVSQSMACRRSVTQLADRLDMPAETFISAVRVLAAIGVLRLGLHHRERRLFVVPFGNSAPIGRLPQFPGIGTLSAASVHRSPLAAAR